MRIYGLTGGIGSGKSAVGRMMREAGVPVLDADLEARRLVEPGQPALEEIEAAFGTKVIRPDGYLDRKALGKIVFADEVARLELDHIMRPHLLAAFKHWVVAQRDTGARIAIYEAALLVEWGGCYALDGLIVVATTPEVQIERIMQRDGLTEAEARQRLAAQTSESERLRVATYVLHNNSTLEVLQKQVALLLGFLRA